MSELPSDRLQESSLFTYCGVNLFGPFTIKSYRKELKKYRVRFTCLCSTLLIEPEAIANSRPMTTETMNDVQIHVPLSPSNLPTMKLKVVILPPGCFGPADAYCRKRWRRT